MIYLAEIHCIHGGSMKSHILFILLPFILQIQLAYGQEFAELTSPGVYNTLSGNEVFNTSTTLVCATTGASEPLWKYKEVQTDSYITQSSTTWDSITGISTLTITTTQQGYYTCTPIAGETTYTVAIFNPDVTVEVTSQDLGAFTRGIDSPQLQLLCRSSDTSIPLDDIQWTSRLDTSLSIPNPFIVSTLSSGIRYLKCNRGNTPFNYAILVQGPPTLTITDTFSTSYTLLPPENNTADITVFSQNILLEVNLITQNSLGRWVTPLDPEIIATSTTISEFTANLAGSYTFYVINFLGNEEQLAIQIKISAIGSNFAELTSSNKYTLLSGNNIFYTDTTLVCVTSDTSIQPVWTYRETQQVVDTTLTGVIWDDSTGISRLDIVTTQQGYYTCTVTGVQSYNVAIFNPDVTTIATDGQRYTYTKGIDSSDTQLLCRPDSNTALSSIRWGTYPNPLILQSLQNQESTITCRVGFSIILQVDLLLQGPPQITLSTTSDTYTELPNSGNANTADITILSKNVMLQVNIYGRWELPDGSSSIESVIEFELFTKDLAGVYKFYVSSWDGSEVLAIQIEISAVGTNFAEITSQGIYSILSGNEVFYADTTLACATSGTSQPQWNYKENQLANDVTQFATTWDSTTGISTLTITTTQQGYYTCTPIAGGITYTIAIFNPDVTVEVTSQVIKSFTRGIDSSQLQLLCRSSDTDIPLDDIQWISRLDTSLSIPNPFIVSTLSNGNHLLKCNRGNTPFNYIIIVQGPPTLTITDTFSTSYTLLPPENNTADITVFSQNLLFEVNLATQNSLGRWVTPLDPEIATSSTTISEFTANLAGLYTFYVINFLGNEELAIQIKISVVGSNFAELTSSNKYTLLSGNNIFYTDTTLVCVTSDTSIQPVWTYRETQQVVDTTLTGVNWDDSTGMSRLDIVTTQQGYYTCTITGVQSYNVAIFNPDVTTIATDGQQYTYTNGIDSSNIQLLCTSDSNTALSSIKWGAVPNPLILQSLQIQESTITCRVGFSTILQVDLLLQGPPQITLSTTSDTYTELPNSGNANTAEINVLSKNVMLQVNIRGRWEFPDGSSSIESVIEFELFTKDLAGVYKFYVSSWDESEVLAMQIEISAVGTNFAEITTQGIYSILSGNEVFYADTTLACVTIGTSQPQWSYKENQLANDVTQSSTTWSPVTGISTLTITTTQQGYYTCTPIAGGTTYTVAIFNPDVTIIATDGQKYTHTKDIDPSDIQLLCTTTDSNTALSDIKWGNSNNPLLLTSVQNQDRTLSCRTQSTDLIILQVNIVVQGPPLLALSTTPGTEYTLLPNSAGSNRADITVLSQNVMLEANLEGRWKLGNVPLETGKLIEIELFTKNSAGLYMFYVTSWDNSEVVAIQIEIAAIGTNFAEITSQGLYKLLSGNEILYTDTTLACATSVTSQPQWSYKENQNGNVYNPSAIDWNPTTGISTLSIHTTEQGYYTCTPIAGETTYIIAIFNPDITIEAQDGEYHYYAKTIDPPNIQLICTTTDPTIQLDDINWDNSPPFNQNPIVLNKILSFASTMTCNIGTTQRLQINLRVQVPSFLLRYTNQDTTSKETYSTQSSRTTIPLFATDVTLSTNFENGVWYYPQRQFEGSTLTLLLFTLLSRGRYTFNTDEVWNRASTDILTLDISTTGIPFAIRTTDGHYIPQSNNSYFYADVTLVCVTDYNTEVYWFYQRGIYDVRKSLISNTADDGISVYDAYIINPGFYSCEVSYDDYIQAYIAGVFSNVNNSVPQLTLSHSTPSVYRFTIPYPDINSISLQVRTADLSISVNQTGKWKLPDGSFTSQQIIYHRIFLYEYFGLYQFYIINWDGIEVCTIQIDIMPDGYNVTDVLSSPSIGKIENGTTLVLSDEYTRIDCAISHQTDTIEWYYRFQPEINATVHLTRATFSIETGISSYSVDSLQPGFYSCIINADMIYSFITADIKSIVQVDNFEDSPQQVDYTVGASASLLYYSNDVIPDSYIHWTTDTVTNDDTHTYSVEYTNPILLSTVYSDMGAGLHVMSCFYRMSPVNYLGSLDLAIKDSLVVTISYEGYSSSFSDTNNPYFPSPQTITILEGTMNITFTCNISECLWKVHNNTDTYNMSIYTIPELLATHEGEYSLVRVTSSGTTYTTANVYIQVIQIPVEPPISLLVPIIIVVVSAFIVVVIMITVIICVAVCVKKRKRKYSNITEGKQEQQQEQSTSKVPGSKAHYDDVKLSRINPRDKEYAELPSNPDYMTIDETIMIPLDTDMDRREYANLSDKPTNIVPHIKQTTKSQNKEYIPLSDLDYTPMSALRISPESIPVNEFAAKHQQYVDSGIMEGSLFWTEFDILNEQSQKNIDLVCNEAMTKKNASKNPITNILPFDENRVVLQSPHFDCNYINASWVESYQFIATINPTKETHRDFLQMIYQTEASMIILLTTRKEKAKIVSGISNRVCYWPKKDQPINCEPFETSLINSTETNAFLRQVICLRDTLTKNEHSFTQYISPNWNEDGTIVEIMAIVALLTRISKQFQDIPHKPIIIHCQDGITKTGIVLTAMGCIKDISIIKTINIFKVIKNLRRQRMKMVPTLASYTTCYSLMNEYCSIHL